MLSRRTRLSTAALMLPGAAIVPASLGYVPFSVAVVIGAVASFAVLAFCITLPDVRPAILRGLFAGLCATLAYDGIRLLLNLVDLVGNPFRSIELYGSVMLGHRGIDSMVTGWTFHFWNGCTFGCFYAAMFRPSTLLKAVVWGIALELALVATSPRLLGLTIRGELLASSFIGHLAFGVVLHLVARRETDLSQ